jgi:hypothetical protein
MRVVGPLSFYLGFRTLDKGQQCKAIELGRLDEFGAFCHVVLAISVSIGF